MARIDHSNCNHPKTTVARTACRKQLTKIEAPATDYIADHIRKVAANGRMKARMDREYTTREAYDPATGRVNTVRVPACTINNTHCENCGNTAPEYVDTGDHPEFQGYSACCNEIVTSRSECRAHHNY